MLEELAYKVDILNSNKFGSFIVRNWFVSEFKRSRTDWQQLVERGDKVADSFKEILGERVVSKKRRHDVTTSTTATSDNVDASSDVKPSKQKKEVTDIVDDWLKPEKKEVKKEKKKKKAKSYLDDL